MGLCDQVLVRHRDHGDVDPGESADLMREDPARVHDDLGLDAPPVHDDSGDPVAIDLDRSDACVGVNLGTAPSRSFGQRVGQLARVDVTVGRQVSSAENTFGRHRRKELLRVVSRDELERQTECLGPPGLARKLFHPLL